MKRVIFLCFVLVCYFFNDGYAQARVILNGASIVIAQEAYLVIDNPAPDAITRSTGFLVSEGENNLIQWNIGTGTGTYSIPWGFNTDYIPLTFTKTAGAGNGQFLFSTYHTGWQNSAELPTGVINMNGASGKDNSSFASDRFWQINAQNYTTKPTLSSLQFTYIDAEHSTTGNTINESNLRANRYSTSLASWTDNILESTLNTTSNTVTVTSIDTTNLRAWWVVGTLGAKLYWVAPTHSTSNLSANWSFTSGGVGNAGIPSLVDALIFDNNNTTNSTIDADLTAANLFVDAGYSGIITQGGSKITLTNTATFSGGTFTGGTADIVVDGAFTLSGTNFTSTSTTLELKKDLIVTSGSFAHNNGTVKFSGTATQNISGPSVTTFDNILVTNTANPGVSVQSKQNIKGILTLGSNVNFDADGSSNTAVFTLLSTADDPVQDAAIAPLPSGAQVSGKVTVQRYMAKEGANNFRIYRYISSPLQNATAADIQKELLITGNFTGSTNRSGNSMFLYNETVVTDINNSGVSDMNDGYFGFPNLANTEILQPGRGYAIFVWGNLYPSTLWDVRGNINAGNETPITFPVTYTSSGNIEYDGWNLIGNPFPSVINWDASSGWTRENIEQSIYVRNNGLEFPNFAAWNGLIGINGGSPYIATAQSFWVKASGGGAPLLSANENIKSSGTTTSFLRTQGTTITNLLRITMVKGSAKDETAIHFREGATEAFDSSVDSRKMFGSSFNLSSLLADNNKLAINSLPPFNCQASVRLAIDNATAGNYQLNFSSLETFSAFIVITLTDKFTNQSFNVSGGGSYSFSVTNNALSYGMNRFVVSFSAAAPKSDFVLNATPLCEGADGIVEINNSQLNITYTAMKGGSTISAVAGTGGTVKILVPKDKLKVGENSFLIIATAESCSTVIERNIIINLAQAPEITSVRSTVQCGAGQVTLTATGAPQNNMYNWYESATSVNSFADQHNGIFITPVLAAPTTYYVSAFNSFGCEGSRKAITAKIVQSIEVKITQSGNTLVSNYETGNQWHFNSEIIPGANQQSIELDKSGLYKVVVTLNTCTGEAEYNFLVSASEEEPSLNAGGISIYPNPVADKVRIVNHEAANGTPVNLLNSLGQLLETATTKLDNGEYACEFDMQNLPTGVYIIRIQGGNKMADTMVIKK